MPMWDASHIYQRYYALTAYSLFRHFWMTLQRECSCRERIMSENESFALTGRVDCATRDMLGHAQIVARMSTKSYGFVSHEYAMARYVQ